MTALNWFLGHIFIWPLDMKGLVPPAAHIRVINVRWSNFSHKTSNRSRNWTFSIGHLRMRTYILIEAAATIRNFTVIKEHLWNLWKYYFVSIVSIVSIKCLTAVILNEWFPLHIILHTHQEYNIVPTTEVILLQSFCFCLASPKSADLN